MGFVVNRNVTLQFEGYMQGAEVTLRAASVQTMLLLREMSVQEAVPALVQHLVRWNLEYEDGSEALPVPMTEEGVLEHLEQPMLAKIIGEWYLVATGASAPLDPPSSDGQPSPDTDSTERSMTMEVL